MHQNESMNNDIFYGNQRHALAGMSMIELLVALTVFSIALAGAIAAVNLIQKETSGFISTDQQTEQNNVDFASAFDNVSRKVAPATPDATNSIGLDFVGLSMDETDCRLNTVGTPNNTSISFNSGISGQSSCPTKSVLLDLNDKMASVGKKFFFSIKGISKLCTAAFADPSQLTGAEGAVNIEVEDSNCLTDSGGNFAAVNSELYLPEYQLVSLDSQRAKAPFSTAIFFPYIRLQEPNSENCLVSRNLDKAVAGFDIDGVQGTGASDVASSASVTISRGFIANEDRLFLSNATYATSTNSVNDTIHTYTGITSTTDGFPSGVTVDATFNASQGFMSLSSSQSVSLSKWEEIFERIRYSNALSTDNNSATNFTPVDRQIIFALGAYPTRLVDGDFHFYNFVGCGSRNCIDWWEAFNEAKSSTKNHLGMTGYLTTITSDEENNFVSDRARATVDGVETWAAGWLGGRDAIDDTVIGDSSVLCPSITGSDRDEGNWYWVTGKAGDELCTKFWSGKQGNGRPINFDGTVSTVVPWAKSDWNCANGSVINAMDDGYYLRESWWYQDRRGRDDFRYANWSGGSTNNTGCAPETNSIGEPNDCCGSTTGSGEDVLQMTGLPSGARLWNDLWGDTKSGYDPGRWYGIQGYFAEWDTSKLGPDVILARETRLNVVRHQEICDDS